MSEPKQVEIRELREAMRRALLGGDPIDFVNAFFRRPPDAPTFPHDYWEKRVCAVAEMLPEIGDLIAKSTETQKPAAWICPACGGGVAPHVTRCPCTPINIMIGDGSSAEPRRAPRDAAILVDRGDGPKRAPRGTT